jgi:hypothetical protein
MDPLLLEWKQDAEALHQGKPHAPALIHSCTGHAANAASTAASCTQNFTSYLLQMIMQRRKGSMQVESSGPGLNVAL